MSSYKVTIISFDDDYYYGSFYLQDDAGLMRNIFLFQLCLDDEGEHSVCIYPQSRSIPFATYVDFEIKDNELEFMLGDLCEVIETRLEQYRSEIFQIVKKHGAFATYTILDDGMQ